MEGEAVLLNLAGVAIALTGFAGLSVALRHEEINDWPQSMRVRLRALVELGVFSFVYALLPIGLYYLGVEEDLLWRLSSLVFVVGVVVLDRQILIRSLPLIRSGEMDRLFPLVSQALVVTVVVANVANVVLSIDMARAFGLYLAGLLVAILITASLFLRLLTFSTQPGDKTD